MITSVLCLTIVVLLAAIATSGHEAMQVCGRGRYFDARAVHDAGARKRDELDDGQRACCLQRKGAGNWTRSALDLCTPAGYASSPAGVRGRWYRSRQRYGGVS